MLPVVAVTNASTVLTDEQVAAVLPALRRQAQVDFYAYWSLRCEMVMLAKNQPLPEGWWQIVVVDNPDMAGALGYHELSETGTPLGKVFAKLDIDSGLSWTVTMSHELLEMLADPWINWCAQGSDDRIYAMEVCDAVEADEIGYTLSADPDGKPCASVRVSDFVTPAWFTPTEARVYDFLGHLKRPLELAPGGYISIFGHGGWTQITASLGVLPNDAEGNTRRMLQAVEAAAAPIGSRRHRRSVPRTSWRKSQPRS
jgi:hypothetical protein